MDDSSEKTSSSENQLKIVQKHNLENRKKLNKQKKEIEKLESKLRSAQRELARVKKENEKLRVAQRAEPKESRDNKSAANQVEEHPVVQVNDLSTNLREVADVFLEWCQTGGAQVGRRHRFEQMLQQHMRRAPEIRGVYRDRNAVQGVSFAGEGEKPQDGVEYWLVQDGSGSWLFPHPQSKQGFRELAPCFSGKATPDKLRVIVPAKMSTAGKLVKRGQVRS